MIPAPLTLKGDVPMGTEKVEKSRWAGGVACVCVSCLLSWDETGTGTLSKRCEIEYVGFLGLP